MKLIRHDKTEIFSNPTSSLTNLKCALYLVVVIATWPGDLKVFKEINSKVDVELPAVNRNASATRYGTPGARSFQSRHI